MATVLLFSGMQAELKITRFNLIFGKVKVT